MKRALLITVLIVGILVALQIRSFKNITALLQRDKPADVLVQLRTLQVANDALQAHLKEQTKSLEDVRSKITSETLEDEITRLKMLAGEQAINGPGIEITLSGSVKAFWISDLIAELVAIGGEAVAVNDIRLMPQTAGFRDVGGGLLMRYAFLRPPLRISIIGPKDDMYRVMSQNGGILDRIKNAHPGLTILVSPKDTIYIQGFQSE